MTAFIDIIYESIYKYINQSLYNKLSTTKYVLVFPQRRFRF